MYFIAATFALTSLVNGATLPHRQTKRDIAADPTCSGKDQGTTFAYASSTSTFDVVCGKDYFGGDLRALQTDSFKDCLTACDSETSCATVAYRDGACYLKGQVTSLSSNDGVWSAKKQGVSTPTGLSCVDKASDGQTHKVGSSQFKIVCGQEYYGGDLSSTSTSSFETCIAACAANNQCVDVSYVNGACYLKQSTSSLVSAPHVWTAQLVVDKPKLSCADSRDNGKSYTGKNGGLYTVECGIDHYGGDLTSVDGTTFESCMDACDTTTGCVDVSWVYGACYLKNTLGSGTTAGHVWTGRLTPSATPKPVVNYLANGNFETGIGINTTNNNIAEWWNPVTSHGTVVQRMEINGNLVHSGKGALTLTQIPKYPWSLDDQAGTMVLIRKTDPVLPAGTVFTFSAWTRQLKPNACTTTFYCGVGMPEQPKSSYQLSTPSATEWSQVTFPCVSPATGATHVQLSVFCAAGNPWTQVYVDDMSITDLVAA